MSGQVMLSLGLILLVSLAAEFVGARTRLPRVTLLVLVGVVAGPNGLGFIPDAINGAAELITSFALTMVAFLLGSELSREKLQRHGKAVMILSATVVLATWWIVGIGLALIGVPLILALIFGAIATATDPAATADVTSEMGAKGSFRDLLVGVVAIDDAWGLIVFAVTIALATAMMGGGALEVGMNLVVELGGAVLIGLATGIPMAILSGRLRPGRPNQLEAIGLVLVCGGLAMWIGASYLLAATVAGAIVANFARHHEYTFRQIEHFEWPFLTVFFVLSGALLDLPLLLTSGVLGLGYLVLRVVGRFIGGWVGGKLIGAPRVENAWFGLGLLPQAGVAVGMGLLAATEFPEHGETILAVTIGTTVIFELAGPILTRMALQRTGASRPAAETPVP